MKAAWFLFALLVISPLNAEASDRASRESVERLIELTEVPKMVDAIQSQVGAMFDGLGEQMNLSADEKAAFESYKGKIIALMHEEVTWEKMKEPILTIYVKHFSEEEVQGLITFYSSDVGKSMTRKMPLVMQESMGMSQSMMQSMMPKIQSLAMEFQQEIAKKRAAQKTDG